MLGKVWNYVSNNLLLTGLVLLAIPSIGTLLGSVAKPTEHWFWEKTGITQGEALLIVLAALGSFWTIAILTASLRRARATATAANADAAAAITDAHAAITDAHAAITDAHAATADADAARAAAAKSAERIARSRTSDYPGTPVVRKVGEGFEWSERRRALMRPLLQRDGEVIERGELFGIVGAWYLRNPLTARAEFSRDIEDAERASIIKILRAVGYANYTLTPEGRNWLLSQNLDSTM